VALHRPDGGREHQPQRIAGPSGEHFAQRRSGQDIARPPEHAFDAGFAAASEPDRFVTGVEQLLEHNATYVAAGTGHQNTHAF
jgi:hypothetical protein